MKSLAEASLPPALVSFVKPARSISPEAAAAASRTHKFDGRVPFGNLFAKRGFAKAHEKRKGKRGERREGRKPRESDPASASPFPSQRPFSRKSLPLFLPLPARLISSGENRRKQFSSARPPIAIVFAPCRKAFAKATARHCRCLKLPLLNQLRGSNES